MKTITYDESKWKLVPVEPTPEMVSAAEEAHMPFGDMDIALRMAILSATSAPATGIADASVQGVNANNCDLVKEQLLEALERIDDSAICDGTDATISDDLFVQLVAALDAPRQPEGDAHKHEAQPEVAQNTGSRSMTNKLSSQGCTGCTGVEGVAAPCETPDAVDIFAWATFDGEGSYDLRLYEDNEGYRDDFRDANPLLHPDWVFPLCRLSDHQRAIAELREECEHLKDCQENAMLHMTGLVSERDTLRQQLAERDAQIASMRAEVTPFIETHWRPVAEQRDRLVGLLRHASSVLGSQGWDALTHEIDAALSDLK